MTKVIKKFMLGIFSCLFLVVSGTVLGGMQAKSVKAATETPAATTSYETLETTTVAIWDKGSIRLKADDYNGIRFICAVNADHYAGLKEGATAGIIVKIGEYTELDHDDGVYDSQAIVWFDENNENGMKYFSAVVWGIPETDSGVRVTARAYTKDSAGAVTYSESCAVRSMAYVADRAYHDVSYDTTDYNDYLLSYIDNAIDSFTLSEDEVTIYSDGDIDRTYQLNPSIKGTGSETDLTVTYQSANTDICTVDAEGVITAVANGRTTVTAKCGNKEATVIVNVTPSADRSMISNAVIVDVNKDINATYTTEEAKLAEGAETGINVAFPANDWGGSTKDVLLQTDVDLVADTDYVFEYNVKVNDEKFGGYTSGFGYRILVTLIGENGEYIDETDGTAAGAQNIIAMSRYTGATNQEYYRCSVRYTPTAAMQNVRFVIRVVATEYTDAVDITLYKFKCFEAADTLGAKIIANNDATGTVEYTNDEQKLANLGAKNGILLKNEEKKTYGGTEGPTIQLDKSLNAGTTYTILYDVKKIAFATTGDKSFEYNFFHAGFSLTNSTYTENGTIWDVTKPYANVNTTEKGHFATKESIGGYDIYHCAKAFTPTENVDNLRIKINLYAANASSYEVVITNVRVVENATEIDTGSLYKLHSTAANAYTQVTDDATALAGLDTNLGIRLYNTVATAYGGSSGFFYRFDAEMTAGETYTITFDLKNIASTLSGTTLGGSYNFAFSADNNTNASTQYWIQSNLNKPGFVTSTTEMEDGSTIYHCTYTFTPTIDMTALRMRVIFYAGSTEYTFDAVLANVVVTPAVTE